VPFWFLQNANIFAAGTYPYQDDDPFVIRQCPHLYIVGDQPRFETKVIEGPQKQSVRLVAVPSFRKTGSLVLVDTETLEVEQIKFHVYSEHKKRQTKEINGKK
jgi:DNA polymerase delta subunit 2